MENNDGSWYYEMHEAGYNYRITDFQCALGSSQLQRLDHFVQSRREIAQKYQEFFFNVNNLKIPGTHDSVDHAYHLYPLQIYFDKLTITKPLFFEKIKMLGINLQVHYIPVHLQPFYKKNFGFAAGDFPIAETLYRHIVSIPIYSSLSDTEVDNVVQVVIQHVTSKVQYQYS